MIKYFTREEMRVILERWYRKDLTEGIISSPNQFTKLLDRIYGKDKSCALDRLAEGQIKDKFNCPKCKGSGQYSEWGKDYGSMGTCPECKGRGKIDIPKGTTGFPMKCHKCNGTGQKQ